MCVSRKKIKNDMKIFEIVLKYPYLNLRLEILYTFGT